MHIWNNYYLLWYFETKILLTYSQKFFENNRQKVADTDFKILPMQINRHIPSPTYILYAYQNALMLLNISTIVKIIPFQ